MQDYYRTLANFRKKSSAIKTGKMMQYVPQDGLYVYFRYDEKQTIMCVMNTAEKDKEVSLENYDERTKGFNKATDVVNKTMLENKFTIPAKTMLVLELMK
jgi:glycosidase